MEGTQTMERQFACLADELEPGTSVTVEGASGDVALFRREDGAFFATTDTCTHALWSLGTDGDLEGNEIVCPLHMARFNIESGEALCLPATGALKTYQVEVEDGKVYVIA